MRSSDIVLMSFLLVLLLIVLWTFFEKWRLENNFVATSGRIYDLGSSRNSGNRVFFKYRFKVSGAAYSGSVGVSCNRKHKNDLSFMLVGIDMPLIYERGNPGNSEMILTRNRVQKYKLHLKMDI